ncbi:MAG: glycerol-3-phosphate acyltransferase [Anaerolineae bacterium]
MALVVAAYLLGSIPFAYLIGRWRGVDLTQVGTRNVGAANLGQVVGRWAGALAFLADMAKGLVPVLAARALRYGGLAAAAAGVAAVAGHCWPLFLRFRGGRGNATGMGAAAGLSPRALVVALLFFALGAATRLLALGMLLGFAVMPLLAWWFGAEGATVTALVAILGLIVVRRLTALGVRQQLAQAEDKGRAVINLLLYDNIAGRRR